MPLAVNSSPSFCVCGGGEYKLVTPRGGGAQGLGCAKYLPGTDDPWLSCLQSTHNPVGGGGGGCQLSRWEGEGELGCTPCVCVCVNRVILIMTHIRVNVALGLMLFGLMLPSALSCSRPYAVWLNVAFGLMSFGLMSFTLMSHSSTCRSV